MARIIQLRTSIQEKEARLVAGVADKSRRMQYELYEYCSDYFWDNYRGVFFADENTAAEVLQNSFVSFWENIENGKIYVEDGVVMGKDKNPLSGSILTYFMGIARYKNLEIAREHPVYVNPETEWGHMIKDVVDGNDIFHDSDEDAMLEIIAEVISHMSPRCSQILTKFYYEEKKLDAILSEISTITSYDALKTKKNKCFKILHDSAIEINKRRLRSSVL